MDGGKDQRKTALLRLLQRFSWANPASCRRFKLVVGSLLLLWSSGNKEKGIIALRQRARRNPMRKIGQAVCCQRQPFRLSHGSQRRLVLLQAMAMLGKARGVAARHRQHASILLGEQDPRFLEQLPNCRRPQARAKD